MHLFTGMCESEAFVFYDDEVTNIMIVFMQYC